MQARGTGGDFFHMGDARSAFDDHLEADRFGAALRGLNRGDQRVNGIDIGRTANLGDHDLVQPVARLFQQVHHVAIPIGRVQAIDPNRQILAAPVHVTDRLNDIGARLWLVIWGNAVFEVQVDDVRGAGGHFLEQSRARAGAKQLTTVGAGRGGGLQAEAHGASSSVMKLRVGHRS